MRSKRLLSIVCLWLLAFARTEYLIAGALVPERVTEDGLYLPGSGLSLRYLWRERYLGQDMTTGDYYVDNFYNPSKLQFGRAGHEFRIGAEYDREGRIKATDYRWGDTAPPFAEYDYRYDLAGNRTGMTVAEGLPGATVTSDYHYFYSGLNRLELEDRAGAFRDYDYDEQGNMTSNPEYEYSYDHFGRLVKVDRGAIKFIYSMSGDKLMKIGPGNIVTAYFYGGGSEILYETEYRDTGASLEPIGSDYYIYSDTGLVAQFSGTPSGAPGFVSRFYDSDVGLYQLGARWYDPSIGRFVSPDPIPSSLNQYAYANNNPFRYQDRSGLQYGSPGYTEWAEQSGFWNKQMGEPGGWDYDCGTRAVLKGCHLMTTGLLVGMAGIGAGIEEAQWQIYMETDCNPACQDGIMLGAPWAEVGAGLRYMGTYSGLRSQLYYSQLIADVEATRMPIIEGHHGAARIFGGFVEQPLYEVEQSMHSMFHRLLNINIKAAKMPPTTGRGYSLRYWEKYMRETAGRQRKAFEVLLNTAKEFDEVHGTQFYKFAKDSIEAGKYEPMP